MTRHDGHPVSQATVLPLLRDEGLILGANYQRERRRVAERRKAAFAKEPTGRNQVWQLDFSEYETTTGGTWRIASCRDYWAKYEFDAHVSPTANMAMDNYAAHKRIEIRDWLAANPRITVHFTPTSGSWLNLVEVWFGIIERQAIRRGTFISVRELMTKIRGFINGWNTRKHPFIWTKTPEEILTKIDRKRKMTSPPSH